MFQTIDHLENVFVVVFTELPVHSLPIHDGGNRLLRPYADALDTAIRNGVITKPGKYGVHIDHLTNRWNVFAIQE